MWNIGGKFKDEQDMLSWGLYDCVVTFQKPTVLSELAKYTGTVGEIGGWLGIFLRTNFWYDSTMAVASAIGKLEDSMQSPSSIKLGQCQRLDSITPVIINGPYDDFLFRKYRQGIIE